MQKPPIIVIVLLSLSMMFLWYMAKKKTNQTTNQNTIIVGTNAEYPPFTFIENNRIVGLDIDIIGEISKRIGKKIEIKDMAFTALIPSLKFNKIQVIAAGMTPTAQRSKNIFFTDSYLENDPLLLITLKKNPISKIEELKNKKVVVNEGYISDIYMSQINGPILQKLATPSQGFDALKKGKSDAFIISKNSSKSYLKEGQQEFSVTIIDETSNNYALGVSKQYPNLYRIIQQTLQQLKKDGTLEKIKKKWGF